MKNYLTIILFLIGLSLICQNDIPDFEFGHELADEFYYEFIDESVPFLDLTNDKFFQKRKENKIKKITVKHLGLSLDSLFQRDTSSFYYLIRKGGFDHGYSYVEEFNFDDNGFKISKNRFPLTSYLNKQDTILLNQRRINSTKSLDSLIVASYIKDTIWEKQVYLKNIVYSTHKEAIMVTLYDSLTNIHTGKLLGYNVVPITYFYNKEDKISRIKCNASKHNNYDMTFSFPNKKSILIKCAIKNYPPDSIKNLENKILKNKLGQIRTSKFYHAAKPENFSSYSFVYDKQNNLCEVNRRTKAKGWFDFTEKLYQYKHTYQNGKLIKTTVHYDFYMGYNDIVYFYNNLGLVNELNIGTYRIYIQYN